MKKEIIGYVGSESGGVGWFFSTDDSEYSYNIPRAIDEVLGIESEDGDRFRITIEKLN